MKKKVLIIGASGLVASRFIDLAKNYLDITGVDEKTLDITQKTQVEEYFNNNNFDTVVNFAAMTNVDAAEKERGDKKGFAWKLNVVGSKNLVDICTKKNIFFVQISTDFVFAGDNKTPGPYSEDSLLPNTLKPSISWYGWTKNRAESLIASSCSRNAVVRIAYPFYPADYSGKLDFAKNYLDLYDRQKLYPIFTDQTMSFLNVDFMIEPLIKILNEELEGTYHLVSQNSATPYEFIAYLLLKARNAKDVLQKSSLKEFLEKPGRTPRPRFGGLKTQITMKKLDMKFATWQEMIDDFVLKLTP